MFEVRGSERGTTPLLASGPLVGLLQTWEGERGALYVSVMQHSSTLNQSHPLQLVCEHTGTEGARLAT